MVPGGDQSQHAVRLHVRGSAQVSFNSTVDDTGRSLTGPGALWLRGQGDDQMVSVRQEEGPERRGHRDVERERQGDEDNREEPDMAAEGQSMQLFLL